MNLIPSNSKSISNIRSSMSFREHVLNLFARFYIPFWNIMILHNFYIFSPFFRVLKCFTLTNSLHNLKSMIRFQTFFHQINHNIISTTYSLTKCNNTLIYKLLSIIKPYISTMRKTRNTYKFSKSSRFCINKHSSNKLRTKLRNTKSTNLRMYLFWSHSKCLC